MKWKEKFRVGKSENILNREAESRRYFTPAFCFSGLILGGALLRGI